MKFGDRHDDGGRARRDVLESLAGAAIMLAAFATPFLRRSRRHWGMTAAAADGCFPGDELIAHPRWSFTHAIDIAAPAADVWPWVAQIGADRGGFYSYEWLENLLGCRLRNTAAIHPEWEVHRSDAFSLHPNMAALRVTLIDSGRYFVAHGAPAARDPGKPWVTGSWLFLVEARGADRCRFVSRYRADYSSDWMTRLTFGPALLEPISFAMDRRMLLGVKERVERGARVSPMPLRAAG